MNICKLCILIEILEAQTMLVLATQQLIGEYQKALYLNQFEKAKIIIKPKKQSNTIQILDNLLLTYTQNNNEIMFEKGYYKFCAQSSISSPDCYRVKLQILNLIVKFSSFSNCFKQFLFKSNQNILIQKKMNSKITQIRNENNNQLKVYKWDSFDRKLTKINIQVSINNNNLIILSFQDNILRKYLQDDSTNFEIFQNMEQIKYFEWQGEYEPNKKKIGKWKATWNGEVILDGGYYKNGLKLGLWEQPIKNYMSIAQVYEVGEYFNDQKTGTWKYIQNNKNIGGGVFNELGQKNQKWVELSDGFWDGSQIIYIGEYKNGNKVGRWDIEFRDDINTAFSLIGGGSYDDAGDELKLGNWVEIIENFGDFPYVKQNGVYKNGKKVGRWDIYWNWNGNQKKIGGGLYDDAGYGLKQGNWVEITDNFQYNSQVTYNGEYKNGQKACRWDIWLKCPYSNKLNEKIGGGQYDSAGYGLKQGDWVEILDNFYDAQLTYNGRYKNGKKIGIWNIQYRYRQSDPFYKIAGGSYDEIGNEIKFGDWFEISDNFQDSYVTCNGGYQYGKKVGRWNFMYEGDQIGGGFYDEENNGVKIGQWIELDQAFFGCKQVTYHGEYQNGRKVGKWNIFAWGQLIGGGLYDEEDDAIKIGQWIELDEAFSGDNQITFQGEYKNGRKVGRWNIYVGQYLIGGGSYHQNGDGLKLGDWIEISDGFQNSSQSTYNGKYKDGKKIGTWRKMRRDINKMQEGFITVEEIKYDN
ncbi:unnamed protein product [Paramecium sonneborni]|uniref:Uncharacterized protein n=1 Tax=Paramecium sonneborni TaxID=65129 RepID=A0A8S1PDQ7_9CILI|nr:unnamed protein product [Paramecium sonneborni]